MKQGDFQIEKVESMGELESLVDKEHLIFCDDMQNAFLIINFKDGQKIGVAYYNYGITPECQYSGDDTLLYLGVGKNFFCINTCKNEVLVNDNLQSIFYELRYDSNRGYVCVICELDVYCYYNGKQKWKMGFRDTIVDYNIIDDAKIFIMCDDGTEYIFYLEDGKIAE